MPSLNIPVPSIDNKLKEQENKEQNTMNKSIDYSITENMKKIEQFLEMDIDFNKNDNKDAHDNNINLKLGNGGLNSNIKKKEVEADLFSDISDTSDSDSILSLSNINNLGKVQKNKNIELSDVEEDDDDDREWWKI